MNGNVDVSDSLEDLTSPFMFKHPLDLYTVALFKLS